MWREGGVGVGGLVVFGERERDRERWGKGLIALSLTRPPGCQSSWKVQLVRLEERSGEEVGEAPQVRLRWLRELIT